MSDITEEHGPFTYLKKTHKNNFARLLYEFKRGGLSNATEKSWRIEDNLENSFLKNYFSLILIKPIIINIVSSKSGNHTDK